MSIVEKINELRKKRNAVILVHNYQLPEVQDIADYTGDSLGLSIQASKTTKDVIVFCGVYFMAETAKIFSPERHVIIPDKDAGCPMADMITVEQLRALKKQHPRAKVLCYVNTSAAVKAECDLCCTSANALKMVQSSLLKDEKEIIFVPDKYLAQYVSSVTGREFIMWHGYCPTHVKILPEHILQQKKLHPDAVVLVHPECTPETIKVADKVLSTEGMCRFAQQAGAREMIIGTEPGIIHRLKKENPGKSFYPASEQALCPNMKRTTLEKVLWSLEEMQYEVVVPSEDLARARGGIQRMLDYKE
jgi:quinolinate synthase